MSIFDDIVLAQALAPYVGHIEQQFDQEYRKYKMTTNDINKTLTERGERYGAFMGHAEIAQRLKGIVFTYTSVRHKELDHDQAEALDMICHKIARILNGDPNYADSWHDIAGYAQLVADRLNRNAR